MTKDNVIKIRDAIKGGKNLPVRVILTDMVTCIDESNALTAVKWDDTNGIIYVYRTQSPQMMESNTNRDNCICLFATDYSNITAIEVGRLKIDDIESTFTTIEATGCSFKSGFKDWILHIFKEAFNKGRWDLDHKDINDIHGRGSNIEQTSVDYRRGVGDYSFKESQRYADRNAKIASGDLKTDEERAEGDTP